MEPHHPHNMGLLVMVPQDMVPQDMAILLNKQDLLLFTLIMMIMMEHLANFVELTPIIHAEEKSDVLQLLGECVSFGSLVFCAVFHAVLMVVKMLRWFASDVRMSKEP